MRPSIARCLNRKISTERNLGSPTQPQINSALSTCSAALKAQDPSSHVLSAYIPSPVRPTYVALRALQLELAKLQPDSASTATGFTSADLKLKFWEDAVNHSLRQSKAINEPIAILLRAAASEGFVLNSTHFDQLFATKRHLLASPVVRELKDVGSMAEGYHSQWAYLVQSLLLSPHLSPSTIALLEQSQQVRDLMVEIMAHLGQGSGIASNVLSVPFFAKRGICMLPIENMNNAGMAQEDLYRLFQGHLEGEAKQKAKEALRDVTYAVATAANDHLLTARSKFGELKGAVQSAIENSGDQMLLERAKMWRGGLSDCIFVPFMIGVPLSEYLCQLEKKHFDIDGKGTKESYWKLVWRTYWSYRERKF